MTPAVGGERFTVRLAIAPLGHFHPNISTLTRRLTPADLLRRYLRSGQDHLTIIIIARYRWIKYHTSDYDEFLRWVFNFEVFEW